MTAVATDLRYHDIDGAVRRGGRGARLRPARRRQVVASMGGEEGATEDLAEATVPTRADAPAQPATRASSSSARPTCGSSWPSAARRCPGDPIIGFVTRGNGVSVHRADCTNADPC